jgi:dihydrofolate synthase/folylpolyglutamate synthase
MSKKNIVEWLESIKRTHTQEIDLSLERVSTIAERLMQGSQRRSVITVGGTNGKGSCVAGLESIYLSAGYRVGTFTSPFLFRYNEQIKIQGIPATDEMICDVFVKIAANCQDITLTPFEWTTLAAFLIFESEDLDIWILEVGLGGRYDAVNILDADVSIVTSIAMDHMAWLGYTREAIAYEKAGICRPDKPAICGDNDPPSSLLNQKVKKWYCQNKQFGFERSSSEWRWWSENGLLENLPHTSLALQNMSVVLMAVELLQNKLAVTKAAIVNGLKDVNLPGRIQVVPGDITVIYDVSHNPASAELLGEFLKNNACNGKTRAVFSMLGDKDILTTLNVIKEQFHTWDIAPLPVQRGASSDFLMKSFKEAAITNVRMHPTIERAFSAVQDVAEKGDRTVVFGSFHTVAGVMSFANKGRL